MYGTCLKADVCDVHDFWMSVEFLSIFQRGSRRHAFRSGHGGARCIHNSPACMQLLHKAKEEHWNRIVLLFAERPPDLMNKLWHRELAGLTQDLAGAAEEGSSEA